MALVLILLAIPSVVIVVAHLSLYVGVVNARLQERRSISRAGSVQNRTDARDTGPTATIVVPARNEETLLPRLLESFEHQTAGRFSIVLVDDQSTDSTGRIMDEFAAAHPDRTRVIHVTETPAIGNSKLNALIVGTRFLTESAPEGPDEPVAPGDFLLFTDADCVVPDTWVEGMAASFTDPEVGLVQGPIETRRTSSFLSRFHAYDHIFKYAYNAGCAGIGQATGGFGNNLGVRVSALIDVGGMESLSISVTEDAALVTALRETMKWRIRARFTRDVTVRTEPQPGFTELTRQEVRWHTGGLFSPDAFSRISYRFLMFYLTVSVVAVPVAVLSPGFWLLPIVSFTTMSGMALLAGALTRQSFRHHWLPFLPFMIFSMCYNSYLTVRAMARPPIVWKGEVLFGYRGSRNRKHRGS